MLSLFSHSFKNDHDWMFFPNVFNSHMKTNKKEKCLKKLNLVCHFVWLLYVFGRFSFLSFLVSTSATIVQSFLHIPVPCYDVQVACLSFGQEVTGLRDQIPRKSKRRLSFAIVRHEWMTEYTTERHEINRHTYTHNYTLLVASKGRKLKRNQITKKVEGGGQ